MIHVQRWSFGSKLAVYSGLLAYGVTDFALLSGQRLAFDGKGLEVKGYIVWRLMLCVLQSKYKGSARW